MITPFVSVVVLVGITLSILLSAYRALRGPTIPDRVVALDNISINLVAAIIVISIRAQSALYIDVALVLAILSFLGTVAAAKYLLRGKVIDGSPLHTRRPG
ncbi:MAG: monovalent cation/H+ antiporter complex subunit F [Desulfurellaceae bacterium]|nr:monovalent cation/H+ antiporter complex subunit F [Desulfurellaceae bacterium]